MENVLAHIKQVKVASDSLCELNEEKRNEILEALSVSLKQSYEIIIQENLKDLALMSQEDPRYDRLLLTKDRIFSMANDVINVVGLPSPIGNIIEERTRPNGLLIQKTSVPLGVVSVIYEARPNVTVDVFSLCFKAGNACILKGGKEAAHSNQILANIITRVLVTHQLNPDIFYLMPAEREATTLLLNATRLIDVCIPRGSQALINYVRENAKIPVIETGAGIVHTYFDSSGDFLKGRAIIDNAKTRRVGVCNALDCLIIHANRVNELPMLMKPLAEKKVELFADKTSYEHLVNNYPPALLHHAAQSDYGQEFLSYKMAIKTVSSVEEAVKHIKHYTSGHSEAIIAEDKKSIDYFLQQVDAAAVYVNASTAFTDGGEFGMGAEIGISTQKLHARGPMALQALTSYKWLVFGNGQVR